MRLSARIVGLWLVVAGSFVLGAQTAPSVSDSVPVSWAHLTVRPRLRDTTSHSALIKYPDAMRNANVEGTVVLEVVVGPDGKPDRSHVRVIRSTYPLFTSAVVAAIAGWHFTPARVNAQVVHAVLPVSVSFTLPEKRREPHREIAAVQIDSAGLQIKLGWERIPPNALVVTNVSDARAAMLAVLTSLIRAANSQPRAATCVSVSEGQGSNVPMDLLRQLQVTFPHVSNANRCPPPYTSMIQELDSAGNPRRAPRGYVEPVWFTLAGVRPWTPDMYVMDASVRQGTSGTDYFCEARRDERGGAWIARCEYLGTWVS